MARFQAIVLVVWFLAQAAAGQDQVTSSTDGAQISRLPAKHLPNAFRLNERVLSGGLPEGELAFAELQELGVKTIISVDGAEPDVATAKKFGLRYVHLPHGYDGISPERSLELAKAVRDLPGSIYIHCHHGKHRSPAAAATACRILGQLDAAEAQAFLQSAGTNPNYRGLYQAVEAAAPHSPADLDQLQVEFRESTPLPPIVESMVEIEHIFDRLKTGLKTPRAASKEGKLDTSTELAPEALLLREQFTELLRHEQTQQEPESYQDLLREAENLAQQLEQILSHKTVPNSTPEQVDQLLKSLSQNCTDCHRQFRDQSKPRSTSIR